MATSLPPRARHSVTAAWVGEGPRENTIANRRASNPTGALACQLDRCLNPAQLDKIIYQLQGQYAEGSGKEGNKMAILRADVRDELAYDVDGFSSYLAQTKVRLMPHPPPHAITIACSVREAWPRADAGPYVRRASVCCSSGRTLRSTATSSPPRSARHGRRRRQTASLRAPPAPCPPPPSPLHRRHHPRCEPRQRRRVRPPPSPPPPSPPPPSPPPRRVRTCQLPGQYYRVYVSPTPGVWRRLRRRAGRTRPDRGDRPVLTPDRSVLRRRLIAASALIELHRFE